MVGRVFERRALLLQPCDQCRNIDLLYRLLTCDRQFGSDPRGLAKELIQRGWLTPYQVNQLFQVGGRDHVLGRYVLLERLGVLGPRSTQESIDSLATFVPPRTTGAFG